MIKFLDWLKKRQQAQKKIPPTAPKPTDQTQNKPSSSRYTHHLSHEELEDAWQASGDPAGLSDRERKRLISQNPRHRYSPEELDMLFKYGTLDKDPNPKTNLPRHHMSPEELEALWKSSGKSNS